MGKVQHDSCWHLLFKQVSIFVRLTNIKCEVVLLSMKLTQRKHLHSHHQCPSMLSWAPARRGAQVTNSFTITYDMGHSCEL